ncbi:hypothetical protein BKA70DRAFT_1435284 [Coprinopsis sp. MPI-PUGE-AT-0042]|nr:hypothetical protein BKA70DRAFT_1435284 [Coprinopsis sp. MPI-PUGE-AT-0042]
MRYNGTLVLVMVYAVWHQEPTRIKRASKPFWGFVTVPPKTSSDIRPPRWYRLSKETEGSLETVERLCVDLSEASTRRLPFLAGTPPIVDESLGPIEAGNVKCYIRLADVDEELYDTLVAAIRSVPLPKGEAGFNWAKGVVRALRDTGKIKILALRNQDLIPAPKPEIHRAESPLVAKLLAMTMEMPPPPVPVSTPRPCPISFESYRELVLDTLGVAFIEDGGLLV